MGEATAPAQGRPLEPRRRPLGRSLVIGLVGGVASGKSAVARLLAERGFEVLDADRLASERLEQPDLRPALRELFGPEVEGPGGKLDRRQIAAVVFRDAERRARLEALVHPQVRAALVERLHAARASGARVVLDVPLLLERGLIDECDVVILVDVPDEMRLARALARGLSEEDWRQREAAQAPLARKRERADHVLDSSKSLAEARRGLDHILQQLGVE